MPMSRCCGGSLVTSRSPIRIRPELSSTKPAIIRSVVVLPQPDGPSKVRNSPSNKKVKLGPNYDAKLYNTEAKVAQLIQVDWKWYNERKDDIDARVTRILRG